MTACSLPYSISLAAKLFVGLLALLVGCAAQDVTRSLPTQALLPFSDSGTFEPPPRWWTEFDDVGLNSQIEHALGNSFDLAIALQRLRAARAVTRREASDLLPDLDGVFSTATNLGPGPNQTRFTSGFEVSYQVDLWGQIQSRVDAERFRADATSFDYHAVALSLSAEVARTWFSLIEAHAQLNLLDEQLETNRTGLADQKLRFGIVDVGGLPDILRQEQLVKSTLEQIVVAQSRVEVLEHQLAVLTGEQPQAASYDAGAELPELPPAPFSGLPSELLMRRPDVRADYLSFVAANHDQAAAISARYPRLNLTGSLVNSATNSDNLFRDWFLSIGSQLIAPLVDGGQRLAEIDRTSAVKARLYNQFGQTMLIAFREVEDNLALERYQIQRIERLREQVELAGQAANQLKQRFFLGNANFLDFLSATQSYQRLQREYLSARLDLILIRIGLHLAIAGGFDTCPQPVATPPFDDPIDLDAARNQQIDQLDEQADRSNRDADGLDQTLPPSTLPPRPTRRLPPTPY